MTREEAEFAIKQLLIKEHDIIDNAINEAKRQGKYSAGIDGNNKLFASIHKETKEKIKEIIAKIK